MNLSVLKTLGLWVTLIPAVLGLLVSQGVILSGSHVDIVVGWIVTILGALGGHTVAAKAIPASSS